VATEARRLGYVVEGACASPVTGAEGNREFFLHLVHGGEPGRGRDFDGVLAKAVEG
jgi:hypothetical protein